MCLLIAEIAMLVAGVWALITGALNDKMFSLLFGKGEYNATPTQARLYGLLLASPLPIAFSFGLVMGILLGEEGTLIAMGFEIVLVITVCIIAAVLARRYKSPITPSTDAAE